jgi:hypothetical protein
LIFSSFALIASGLKAYGSNFPLSHAIMDDPQLIDGAIGFLLPYGFLDSRHLSSPLLRMKMIRFTIDV